MTELDSLNIKVQATSDSANRTIDNLISKVGSLENAFERIGNLNTTNLSNQIRMLGSATQSFKQGGVTGREFTTIANGLQKISSVDSNKLRTTASAMQQIASAIHTFSSVGGAISTLSSTTKAISRLGAISSSGSMATIGNSINSFVTSLNSVPQLTFNAESLTQSINAISRLGGKNSRNAVTTIPILTSTLKNFVETMNSIGGITESTSGITQLANAISMMGRKTSTNAITNMPKLASGLKQMMTTLKDAPQVSENLIRMTNALASLSSNGSRVATTVNGLSKNYKLFSTRTRSLTTHSKGLASAIGSLYARFWIFMRAFRLLGSAITYASDLIEVQNVIDNTFGVSTTESINANADAISHLADNTIEWFGMSELTTKTIAGRYMAMGSAMGLASQKSDGLSSNLSSLMGEMGNVTNKASEMALNITALAGDMASFYNVDAETMSESLASGIYSGQVRALRSYGLDLTIATLQEYALSKGITEKVQSMTQAEKTLLRYQYVMERTQNVQGDFMRTQNTWANQTRMLKQNLQQLGSVVGEVMIHALKGFVTWTNKALLSLTSFAVECANALGKIFGWEVETSGGSSDIGDLADDTEDLTSGLDGATDSAEKLKNVLQGFDKLNLITTTSSSDSGSGSGSDTTSALDTSSWNVKKTDGLLKSYESDIVNLGDLGYMIQDKMASAMEKIDWDKIYLKAKGFGSGLANYLNGLLTPRLFGAIGDTIGGGINTAIYTGLSFVETFNWAQFGKSFATGLNRLFRKIDWKSAGKLFGKGINGIVTSVNNFLTSTDWKRLGKSFYDFIKSAIETINWKQLTKLVTNSYKALMDFGGTATGTGKAFNVIATSVLALMGAFKGYTAITNATKSLKNLGTAITTSSIATKLGAIGVSTTALTTASVALASAIGLLALGAFGEYLAQCELARKSQEQLDKAWGSKKNYETFKNELEDLATKFDTLQERIKNAKTEMETDVSSGEGEYQYIDDLIDSYYRLQTQTNLTNKEKQTMLNLAKKLVEYFPELQDYYDSETGSIKKTKDELKKLNSARLEEIKTSAMEDLLTEEYKAYYESLSDVEDAYKKLASAQNTLDKYVQANEKHLRLAKDVYEGIIPSAEGFGSAISSISPGVKLASGQVDQLNNILTRLNKYGLSGKKAKEFTKLMKDLEDGVLDNADSMYILYEAYDIYRNTLDDTSDEYETYRTTVDKMTQDVNDAKKVYNGATKSMNEIVDTVKQYGSQVGLSDTNLRKANDYILNKFPSASKVFEKVYGSASDVGDAFANIVKYNGQKVTMSTKVNGASTVPDLLSGLKSFTKYNGTTVTTKYKNTTTSGSQSPKGFLGTLKDIFSYSGKTVSLKSKIELSKKIQGATYDLLSLFTLIGKADGGVFSNGGWKPIQQYASGGVPDMGQYFIARESGPELVGTIGGHTAVMNNDQIVASVSNGVYNAVRSAMGGGQNVTVNVTLQGDADGLFEVVQNKNNQYKRVNGHSAF